MCCYRVYVLTDKPLLYSSCGRRLFGRPYQLPFPHRFTSLFPRPHTPPGPPPRAKLWPPTGEWSVYIGPTGAIDEHMAQLAEQTPQPHPHQAPHHHVASHRVVNPHTQHTCCAYPPRSRRGAHRDKRREHTWWIYMNAAYFQHRPSYSNTARRRPGARRGSTGIPFRRLARQRQRRSPPRARALPPGRTPAGNMPTAASPSSTSRNGAGGVRAPGSR